MLSLYSCNRKKAPSGTVITHFDSPQHPTIPTGRIRLLDSIVLRFHKDFEDDTVFISNSGSDLGYLVANTNYSIAYATEFTIKKKSKGEIKIQIANIEYVISQHPDYLFIDVYYDRNRKTMNINYSNNILVLS
jgi:hypothetical protein